MLSWDMLVVVGVMMRNQVWWCHVWLVVTMVVMVMVVVVLVVVVEVWRRWWLVVVMVVMVVVMVARWEMVHESRHGMVVMVGVRNGRGVVAHIRRVGRSVGIRPRNRRRVTGGGWGSPGWCIGGRSCRSTGSSFRFWGPDVQLWTILREVSISFASGTGRLDLLCGCAGKGPQRKESQGEAKAENA